MTSKRTLEALRDAKHVARERFAWPGGYPLFLIMENGGVLCPACIKSEWKQIARNTLTYRRGHCTGWESAGGAINWEDPALFCDHCNAHIPSAYGAENDEQLAGVEPESGAA